VIELEDDPNRRGRFRFNGYRPRHPSPEQTTSSNGGLVADAQAARDAQEPGENTTAPAGYTVVPVAGAGRSDV
jgi:hypothetical protein